MQRRSSARTSRRDSPYGFASSRARTARRRPAEAGRQRPAAGVLSGGGPVGLVVVSCWSVTAAARAGRPRLRLWWAWCLLGRSGARPTASGDVQIEGAGLNSPRPSGGWATGPLGAVTPGGPSGPVQRGCVSTQPVHIATGSPGKPREKLGALGTPRGTVKARFPWSEGKGGRVGLYAGFCLPGALRPPGRRSSIWDRCCHRPRAVYPRTRAGRPRSSAQGRFRGPS